MASNVKPVTMGDDEAHRWAQSHAAFASTELLRSAPWARTYRLAGGPAAAYLKILPDHQASVLRPATLLSDRFPRHVPKVIASDIRSGWMLSADHQGQMMSYDTPERDLRKLLKTYARFQVEAVALQDLLSSLPKPDLSELPAALIDFLEPRNVESDGGSGFVGAAYFIGRSEAKRYFQTLSRRRFLLKRHLEPASLLPNTLNHGDLRPPNVAMGSDGACILCDWDDAFVGPAGMSLHAMFSGCFKPTILLTEGRAAAEAEVSKRYARRLDAYLSVLAKEGYADEDMLRHALPASICAGVLQYILNFRKYPDDSRSYRKAVARSMKRRLSDLLDLCDLLASRERLTALEFAKDYEESGQDRRAQYLLQDYVADHPEDADAYTILARVLNKRGRNDEALATCRRALELAPDMATAHNELGVVLLTDFKVEEARTHFNKAIECDPEHAGAKDNLDRTAALDDMRRRAAESGVVPTLLYTPAETSDGLPRPEKLALAASMFNRYGVLQVDNAFPVDLIQRLRDAFFERYTSYFRKDDHPDALRLGDRRYMLTVDMEEPFNDPALFASPLVLPIFQKLLGDDCVVGAFTSVISLPGSKNQSLHKDHPALYPSTRWHHRLPSFAIQLIVPLVPLDDVVGTTRVIKGSHTVPASDAKKMEMQDPFVPLGSCLINDYRLSHHGLGNRSNKVRPILTIIYNRPWFRDYVNYSKQPPLRVGDEQYDRLPKEHRKMFSWWKEERLR